MNQSVDQLLGVLKYFASYKPVSSVVLGQRFFLHIWLKSWNLHVLRVFEDNKPLWSGSLSLPLNPDRRTPGWNEKRWDSVAASTPRQQRCLSTILWRHTWMLSRLYLWKFTVAWVIWSDSGISSVKHSFFQNSVQRSGNVSCLWPKISWLSSFVKCHFLNYRSFNFDFLLATTSVPICIGMSGCTHPSTALVLINRGWAGASYSFGLRITRWGLFTGRSEA